MYPDLPDLTGGTHSPHLTTVASIRVLHRRSWTSWPRSHCVGKLPPAEAENQSYLSLSNIIVEAEY